MTACPTDSTVVVAPQTIRTCPGCFHRVIKVTHCGEVNCSKYGDNDHYHCNAPKCKESCARTGTCRPMQLNATDYVKELTFL